MSGNIPGENFWVGGNFPGESLMGGDFLGGNFPKGDFLEPSFMFYQKKLIFFIFM